MDKTENPSPPEAKEMSFIEHLEELRWHLMRAAIGVVIFTLVAFLNTKFFFHTIILGPSRTDFWTYKALCAFGKWMNSPSLCIDKLDFTIQSRQMSGQFMMHLSSSFVIGLICAFPYVFWEIWQFIKPGLYDKERKAANGATFIVSLLFMLGVVFGYFVVAPLSINFLASYKIDDSIINEFDIISYVSTVVTLVLGCALLFQLPVVVYFLAAAGIISSQMMITYRRHAIVLILILAAIITPPDVFSQIIVSIPLLILYQIGIYIAKRVEKQAALAEKPA